MAHGLRSAQAKNKLSREFSADRPPPLPHGNSGSGEPQPPCEAEKQHDMLHA